MKNAETMTFPIEKPLDFFSKTNYYCDCYLEIYELVWELDCFENVDKDETGSFLFFKIVFSSEFEQVYHVPRCRRRSA